MPVSIKIREFEDEGHRTPDGRPLTLEQFAQHYGRKYGIRIPPATKIKGTIRAYISRGRWVINCPDCNSAMPGSMAARVFICAECGSPDNDGMWRKVTFPIGKAAIEQLLGARSKRNRNMAIGETAADLRRENLAHGLED